jgi:hypothetical protein
MHPSSPGEPLDEAVKLVGANGTAIQADASARCPRIGATGCALRTAAVFQDRRPSEITAQILSRSWDSSIS